jgi:hypothetical protein
MDELNVGTALYDGENFVGHRPRVCGEHRTAGSHRAWCYDCGEWCYPESPCVRCEIIQLREAAVRRRAAGLVHEDD